MVTKEDAKQIVEGLLEVTGASCITETQEFYAAKAAMALGNYANAAMWLHALFSEVAKDSAEAFDVLNAK